ncbi:hypothetical protein [Streptomyces sp. NBC_01244]|uniref:hypothetical protein n=1 Tax=Streptomyces sp. NBC_01244 TaxID=2903797 RepID=UPI002E0E50DA|nr:hypothetical protein OG247_33280 [Streptomyces sp. NBC_01244]
MSEITADAGIQAIASPLSLLIEEEAHHDRQLQEVLMLSFTCDPGFIESFALGAAQAAGARVTVVGDVAVTSADPRSVRRAGRSYVAGLAQCRSGAAFHPKLVLLAGPKRVTVAIGSGNATLAGWHANSELWSTVRGDADRSPALFGDLAHWLRGLPGPVRFSAGVAEALERCAVLLDSPGGHAPTSGEGARLVSSVTGPILHQLPVGPVDELAVSAPFHDLGAGALHALVRRLAPKRLTVVYQPDKVRLDGPAVADLVEQYGGELRVDGEHERYRHGKLVEWSVDGQRWTLTGSPNLSRAALLRSVADGGNCELGIVAPTGRTLVPAGAPQTPTAIRSLRLEPPAERSTDVALLLGAARVPDGVDVLIARMPDRPGYLQLSRAAAPPESWERVGDVPAGSAQCTIGLPAEGGSRVRLVVPGYDGVPVYSNVVFVVDPVRATQRPGAGAGHAAAPTTRPDELFGDPLLAERFFTDVAQLRSGLSVRAEGGSAVPAHGAAATRKTDADADADSWEDYLDRCAGRMGNPLLHFALGLPALPDGSADVAHRELLRVSWDERGDERFENDEEEAGFEEDGAEQPSRVFELPDLGTRGEEERRRYRRWAARLAEATPSLGPAERLLAVRLLLWTVAAQAWPAGDTAWVPLLASAVAGLDGDGLPEEAQVPAGSLAAVALSVLRAHIPRYENTGEALAFRRACRATGHLLVAADEGCVDAYTAVLADAFGGAVHPETVLDLIDDIVQDDPLTEAIAALEERGHVAHRHDGQVLHVHGRFGTPALAAVEAVGAAQDAPLIGAWATTDSGTWAFAAWQRPDLVVLDAGRGRPLWRHYRLTPLGSPRALALSRSFAAAKSVPHGPQLQPFSEALALFSALGVDDFHPPEDCR